jgi:hypothetical protein
MFSKNTSSHVLCVIVIVRLGLEWDDERVVVSVVVMVDEGSAERDWERESDRVTDASTVGPDNELLLDQERDFVSEGGDESVTDGVWLTVRELLPLGSLVLLTDVVMDSSAVRETEGVMTDRVKDMVLESPDAERSFEGVVVGECDMMVKLPSFVTETVQVRSSVGDGNVLEVVRVSVSVCSTVSERNEPDSVLVDDISALVEGVEEAVGLGEGEGDADTDAEPSDCECSLLTVADLENSAVLERPETDGVGEFDVEGDPLTEGSLESEFDGVNDIEEDSESEIDKEALKETSRVAVSESDLATLVEGDTVGDDDVDADGDREGSDESVPTVGLCERVTDGDDVWVADTVAECEIEPLCERLLDNDSDAVTETERVHVNVRLADRSSVAVWEGVRRDREAE